MVIYKIIQILEKILKTNNMKNMKRYNLIEDGIIHTSDLSYEWATEMLEGHTNTFPDVDFWIEPMENRK